MKMVDLTHRITEDMPLFPGMVPPRLERIGKGGSRETGIFLSSHLGTHMDAPAHTVQTGDFLEQLPLERFFGLALLVDVSSFCGGTIPRSFLEGFQDALQFSQFLVLHSGQYRLWGQPDYLQGFPVLSEESARFLGAMPGLSGVGLDSISADPVESADLPIHQILLGSGKLILENLTNLDQIQGEHFLLSAFPLFYAQADGCPLRAVAFQAPAGIYYPK